MIDSYSCPVCGGDEWFPVEAFVYSRTKGTPTRALAVARIWRRLNTIGRILLLPRPRRRPVKCRALTPYQLLRWRVLFEVWFPGRDAVALTATSCETCGFVCYSPRPTDKDVAAKYAFLKRHEPDIGGQAGYDCLALRHDLERAKKVYERCIAHLEEKKLRVLDYGGGNGKLMQPFVAAGHSCYLVDYNEHPLPGVTKICDDLTGFRGDDTFDLVVCSHVLEHVGDVAGLTSFLRSRLVQDGLLYVEVPREIWAGLGIEADPVTHINYFSENSLKSLLLLNGFQLLGGRFETADYGGAPLDIVWIVARPAARSSDVNGEGRPGVLPPDVKPLLFPSRITSLRRTYRLSIAPLFGALRRRMGRSTPDNPTSGSPPARSPGS